MSIRKPQLSWGHININVAELDRSIEFYRRLGFEAFLPSIPYLGLTRDPGHDPIGEAEGSALGLAAGTSGRACIMQLGDGFPKLDLTELSGEAPLAPPVSKDLGVVRICLATEDLQGDYAALVEQGVEFISKPQLCTDGLADIAVCRDPDGTLIELIQIYLDRWAAHIPS